VRFEIGELVLERAFRAVAEQPRFVDYAPVKLRIVDGGRRYREGAQKREYGEDFPHRFLSPPLVPAKAGTQSLALDSRLRGNERIVL
jgi:hypothetical protein